MREFVLRVFVCLLCCLAFSACCLWTGKCQEPPVEPPPPPPPPPPSTSPLGTNIGAVVDWTSEISFVDAFKMSRSWVSGTVGGAWDDGRPVHVDDHGWVQSLLPDQVIHTFVFWSDQRPSFVGGNFVITYEGDGELVYFNHVEVVSHAPGRDVVKLDAARGGLAIDLVRTNPDNYLRNIQIRAEADEASTTVFSPAFLESLKTFSVVRFMDWGRTNDAVATTWENRPKPSDATYASSRGVPVEVMVALANEAKIDPWFCMPHWADDAWVRGYAEAVKKRLDPNRKVYLEHSNEVWNAIFPAFHHALEQARKDPERFRIADGDFAALVNYHSARSVEIFKIWEEVFGGPERLVRVMGAWAAVDWTSQALLAFEDARAHTDAVAVAPYFGGDLGHGEEAVRAAGLTLDQLFAELERTAIPQAVEMVRKHKVHTAAAGVHLIAYEGGQHLVGVGPALDDKRLNALFDAANADPRMANLYATYLAGWREAGGELFVNFSSVGGMSRFGRWGVRLDLLQPIDAFPKAKALQDFAQSNPRWW